MPLNILRLNQRRQHPTERITFIKALPGGSHELAQEYLERVAAICHPILRRHQLSVTSLEEFPANREFAGRNFNAGECVQLVLRGRSGAWLPFRAVVMVMMHELAHNSHMNHGKAFWAVRDAYAADMRALWAQGYTGEGVWGPGRELRTGVKIGGGREVEGDMPEHLCGGTYRSRRANKRKRAAAAPEKPDLTWREKRDRRIEKKFGVNGQQLGEDQSARMALQGFKGPTTKSRVAGSKRGRELRAAAALARFEQAASVQKKQEQEADELEARDGEDEEDSGEDYEYEDAEFANAQDIDGSDLRDSKGQKMIKVCEDEDADDVHVKRELEELYKWEAPGSEDLATEDPEPERPPDLPAAPEIASDISNGQGREPAQPNAKEESMLSDHPLGDTQSPESPSSDQTCKACSMSNEATALLCAACSNVLDPKRSPGCWKCQSDACINGPYLNPADYGVCGVCGGRRV